MLRAGDCVSIGGVALYFFPANKDQEARLARNRTQPGHTVSPAVTLGYLSALQALTLVQFLPSFGGEYGALIPLAFGALCAMMWGLYFLYRLLRRAAFEAETLAFFLITLNFAVTAAYAPDLLRTQVAAVGLGIVIFLLLSFVLRNLRLSVKLRWPVAAAAAVLLAFNVLFGQQIFGAKNWIAVGPVSFQPSEFVKLAFILVGAATLDRLFARRNLIFTLVFSAYCVGCLALMSDFGTALVFFVAFLCIAFLRTGDLASLVMMATAAVFAGGIVLRFKPYHAWEYTQSLGYQQSRTMSAIASGGLFGVGPENGWLKELGAANTDLVFGVLGEEFGLLLALCAILALIVLAVFTLESTSTARSSFYTIVSCAATAMLIFQTTLNVMGAVDLLPLTGVTFPFVSVGGSSMAACWGLLAFLKAADTRQNASFILRLPRKIRAARAKPLRDGERADADDLDALFARKPDIPVDEIFGKGGDGQ